MDVIHDTPFAAGLQPILDKDGAEGRVAILKAAYELRPGGALVVAEEQMPLCHVDEYLGEPGRSSVVYEADGAYFKPATDVVLVGTVYAPRGRPSPVVEASLSVGTLSKSVVVFGDRRWHVRAAAGPAISEATPFTEMPLCWERAFGGADLGRSEAASRGWEPRNPIGIGYLATAGSAGVDGTVLPNVEDPRALISRWSDRPAPAGVGFVGRSWEPRRAYAGTFDEVWRRHRMPILPADFDDRFFNAAPADLVYPGYLRGGEAVRALNLSPAGVERFDLPALRVQFRGTARRRRFQIDANLDTVVVNLDRRRLVLVWRARYHVHLNEAADVVTATVTVSR